MRASRWDPKVIEDKTPSTASLHRFVRDIKDIKHKPLPRIYVFPEEDLSKLHAVVVGLPGTPYEDGFFHFFVKCSPSYPIKPPLVRLLTKDAGRVRFNPNLYACGKSLLIKEPFLNEPLLAEAFLNDYQDYKRKLEHETIRVAVCSAVEACMQDNPPCPLDLVAVIISEFTEHYDKERPNRSAMDSKSSRGTTQIALVGANWEDPEHHVKSRSKPSEDVITGFDVRLLRGRGSELSGRASGDGDRNRRL
ncbi:ubiquitin-conjugating enzyme E2 Z [Rhipicephalus microplus]|uniref:ubiquitin-conjugating enzyme E2 Z n=1 Tax=Rhipicephalus microplus TaxID=6941 RepID=UPI003F6D3300